MFSIRSIAATSFIMLFVTAPLVAQRAVTLSAQGGGYSSTSNLNDAGADFDTGFSLGGGVGVVLTKNIALRANFTWAQSNFDGPSTMSLSGSDINRFYYGGDIQLRVPVGRFSPYVFGGAGGVTLDETGAGTLDGFTKVAGRFGLGVSYEIPGTKFGVFSEGTGWVYDFDRSGLNDTQFDIGWTGGLSYRLF